MCACVKKKEREGDSKNGKEIKKKKRKRCVCVCMRVYMCMCTRIYVYWTYFHLQLWPLRLLHDVVSLGPLILAMDPRGSKTTPDPIPTFARDWHRPTLPRGPEGEAGAGAGARGEGEGGVNEEGGGEFCVPIIQG